MDHYPRSRGSSPSARTRASSYRTSRSQPDIAVAAATVSAQRSLSAQNSQSADSPSDGADETVDGTIVESLVVPSRGKKNLILLVYYLFIYLFICFFF